MSSVALAQPANQLGNPGFESPAFGKETNFSLIYPWQDDGIDYVNSGIEDTGAHSGTYRAFEMSGDDGAYQISNYQMQNGDQITLSWWALATVSVATNPPVQVVGLLRAGTTSDAFSICAPLAVTSNGLPGNWTQYTMNYTAGIADAGRYVGCYFNTTNAFGFATNRLLPGGSSRR